MAKKKKPAGARQRKKVAASVVENERRRRFVEAFMANGGNATKAAEAAGYSRASAGNQAHRLMKNDEIRLAIKERQENDPAVATRAERQAFWTRLMKDPNKEDSTRLKASELLGKSQADFVEVRMAPIVTDPHASDEQLVEKIQNLLAVADERAAQAAKAAKK